MQVPKTKKYSYDSINNRLYVENMIPATKSENNEVGSCNICDATLASLSYHVANDQYIVVNQCTECKIMSANIYDNRWDWICEFPISHFSASLEKTGEMKKNNEIVKNIEQLERIPVKKLRTIFSATNIEAMIARAKGDKYIRQYLYNARQKYKLFYEVFGIQIDI